MTQGQENVKPFQLVFHDIENMHIINYCKKTYIKLGTLKQKHT